MLVYFGYSFCPDVCPMALEHMTMALEMMPTQRAQQFIPVFITVDPQRDTVGHLRTYMANYPPSFIALTGTAEQLAPVHKAYHVYAQVVDDPGSQKDSKNYIMDHSSIVFVMDRQGRFVTSFNHQTPPAQIAAMLSRL
jgi:protein SCO1/2